MEFQLSQISNTIDTRVSSRNYIRTRLTHRIVQARLMVLGTSQIKIGLGSEIQKNEHGSKQNSFYNGHVEKWTWFHKNLKSDHLRLKIDIRCFLEVLENNHLWQKEKRKTVNKQQQYGSPHPENVLLAHPSLLCTGWGISSWCTHRQPDKEKSMKN